MGVPGRPGHAGRRGRDLRLHPPDPRSAEDAGRHARPRLRRERPVHQRLQRTWRVRERTGGETPWAWWARRCSAGSGRWRRPGCGRGCSPRCERPTGWSEVRCSTIPPQTPKVSAAMHAKSILSQVSQSDRLRWRASANSSAAVAPCRKRPRRPGARWRDHGGDDGDPRRRGGFRGRLHPHRRSGRRRSRDRAGRGGRDRAGSRGADVARRARRSAPGLPSAASGGTDRVRPVRDRQPGRSPPGAAARARYRLPGPGRANSSRHGGAGAAQPLGAETRAVHAAGFWRDGRPGRGPRGRRPAQRPGQARRRPRAGSGLPRGARGGAAHQPRLGGDGAEGGGAGRAGALRRFGAHGAGDRDGGGGEPDVGGRGGARRLRGVHSPRADHFEP